MIYFFILFFYHVKLYNRDFDFSPKHNIYIHTNSILRLSTQSSFQDTYAIHIVLLWICIIQRIPGIHFTRIKSFDLIVLHESENYAHITVLCVMRLLHCVSAVWEINMYIYISNTLIYVRCGKYVFMKK